MKISNYNYIFYKDDMSFWMNGITKKFFRLSRDAGQKVEKILNRRSWEELPRYLIDKLQESGFIITNDKEELNDIRNLNKQTSQSRNYFLVILPTLNCNFKCWYCIQNHIPSVMTETTKKKSLSISNIWLKKKKSQHYTLNGLGESRLWVTRM